MTIKCYMNEVDSVIDMSIRSRYLRIFLRRPLFLIALSVVLISITTAIIKGYRLWSRTTLTNATKIARSIDVEYDDEEKCREPRMNIVFLKTHKTGSSTITNILNRFAETHNLSVALPTDGFHNFLWPLPFQTDFVQNKVRQPNILSNHARFNAGPLMELMPTITKYVTILRYPATQFPSLFKFMDLGGLIGVNNKQKSISLEYFLDNAVALLKSLHQQNSQILINNPSLYLLRNPQLFDLGFDQWFSENEEIIGKAIVEISKKFNMVLIMEYFDESLVLLKRKMCWTLDDVVYFKLNKQIAMNELLTQGIRKKILQWTKADVMLYDYFNKSLWNGITKEGESFWEEVALLRRRNKELSEACLRTGEFFDRPYKGSTAVIHGYSLKGNISVKLESSCKQMIRSEMNYIEHFRTIYNTL